MIQREWMLCKQRKSHNFQFERFLGRTEVRAHRLICLSSVLNEVVTKIKHQHCSTAHFICKHFDMISHTHLTASSKYSEFYDSIP